MAFIEYAPSKALRNYVQCYWYLDDAYQEPIVDDFYPNGCVKVVFSIELDVNRIGTDGTLNKEPWTEIIGQMTKPYRLKVGGMGKTFCIRFYAHGFSRFSNIPLNELNDLTLSSDYLFAKDFGQFVGDCLIDGKIQRLIEGVDAFLTSKLFENDLGLKDEISEHAVKFVLRNPNNPNWDELVRQCGISHRYLQRIFMEKIGFSPKFYQRVVRFQKVLKHFSETPYINFTETAHRFGYFDQAHFIKDFKHFTNTTPSLFFHENRPMNKYFIDHKGRSFFYNPLFSD
ncbi:MAG: AraC family transcriptional regulator [Muricauda sp.]|nr:helix-turn-helix domain-containing protein [Allomuricauda sp.]MBA4745676.1 AraC family transcriptional regulator [Allomuricauda sp.]